MGRIRWEMEVGDKKSCESPATARSQEVEGHFREIGRGGGLQRCQGNSPLKKPQTNEREERTKLLRLSGEGNTE